MGAKSFSVTSNVYGSFPEFSVDHLLKFTDILEPDQFVTFEFHMEVFFNGEYDVHVVK